MKKYLVVSMMAALAMPLAAQADSDSAKEHVKQKANHHAAGLLKKADVNHDGQVSKSEFMAHAATMFNKLDKNHDGVISRDDRGRKLSPERRASILKRFDKDGNGKLSKEERAAAREARANR